MWWNIYLMNLNLLVLFSGLAAGIFRSETSKLPTLSIQLNYGVAVTNVGNGDGPMEWVVAGFNGPNLVLQYNQATGTYSNIAVRNSAYENLMDPNGAAIGVCACDVDGDGLEEIYFLNTNNRYSGPKLVKDKLFKWHNGNYIDLFSTEGNEDVSGMFAGRSVACVDRTGNGKYGILVATYAEDSQGQFGLVEMNEDDPRNNPAAGRTMLHDVARKYGVNFSTGGRGIAVGPILGDDGFSDIYFVNEGNWRLGNRGDNALFKNNGSGYFSNVAGQMDLNDTSPGRGVALADFNNDQLTDIVYGNWMNEHKLQIQGSTSTGGVTFTNVATAEFARASPIRTVIAADFDNNGNLDVFMNNIVYSHYDSRNRLFEIQPNGDYVNITPLPVGDAEEPEGYGTGASVADIDNDGVLELMIAHGESRAEGLTFYHVGVPQAYSNNWIRFLPLTQHGAPARGAKVTVTLAGAENTKLTRIIDGGSGYLCAMEPVAHIGLGSRSVRSVEVTWPNGQRKTLNLSGNDVNKTHVVSFAGGVSSTPANQGVVRENSGEAVVGYGSAASTGGSSSATQGRRPSTEYVNRPSDRRETAPRPSSRRRSQRRGSETLRPNRRLNVAGRWQTRQRRTRYPQVIRTTPRPVYNRIMTTPRPVYNRIRTTPRPVYNRIRTTPRPVYSRIRTTPRPVYNRVRPTQSLYSDNQGRRLPLTTQQPSRVVTWTQRPAYSVTARPGDSQRWYYNPRQIYPSNRGRRLPSSNTQESRIIATTTQSSVNSWRRYSNRRPLHSNNHRRTHSNNYRPTLSNSNRQTSPNSSRTAPSNSQRRTRPDNRRRFYNSYPRRSSYYRARHGYIRPNEGQTHNEGESMRERNLRYSGGYHSRLGTSSSRQRVPRDS